MATVLTVAERSTNWARVMEAELAAARDVDVAQDRVVAVDEAPTERRGR